ncbi:MAG: winged helix-turn-helix domain-containing protein [Polyangiaceae bacterium]|nr:winged helix-turn-helix domain-containing protein [Polyangiaceae bacterium]
MAKILLVEDESDIREVVCFNLRAAGHDVFEAPSGDAGVQLAKTHQPDVILLDIMLPDRSGLDVCRVLKSDATTKNSAVIMLTAKSEEIDRVVGFEIGADDYVTKPFSVRELTLRVNAMLRRSQAPVPVAALIEFGVLRIDEEAHRVWVEGNELELTALEFKLLTTLYQRRDRVQSRSVLLDEVWGIQADVTTRTVDTHVKRLREKLQAARAYIETVRGVGYRFLGHPNGASE